VAEAVALVDIGSNSIRLVIYAGRDRPGDRILSEKVTAGLGRLDRRRRLPADGLRIAMDGLRRFRKIADEIGVDVVHAFATAAVRDAADGKAFLRDVRKMGFECELIPGRAEAELAARGVLVGIPDADGLVADLGGGSLDLAWIERGEQGAGISLDLGILRVGADEEKRARREIAGALADDRLRLHAKDHDLYLVGGSFRTLARIDRALTGRETEKVRGYAMKPSRAAAIRRALSKEADRLAKLVDDPRLKTSPIAAMLLDVLVEESKPARIVVSGFGVREGYLTTLR
jgi:exopolyphosphatase/guanosine-5'-triphosphate,3'-diphosphate pyrophosphatase